MNALGSAALATLVGLTTTACINLEWSRTRVRQEVDRAALASLPRSGIGLDRCLDVLGAPTYVWENRVHGLIVAWSWQNEREFGVSLSVPIYRSQSASVQYTDTDFKEKGLVAWFDDDWRLEDWREGYLSELVARNQRPATIDQIEAP